MQKVATVAVVVTFLAATGCSDLSRTQQRVLSGGAIGAGVGAVGTVITGGCVSCGAAIGAGVGAIGGYIYDQSKRDSYR